MTCALRMLAYEIPADAFDENFEVSESVCIASMKKFAQNVVEIYEDEYLRAPTKADIELLLEENAERGFSGMLF